MSNTAEGFGRHSAKDFCRFLFITKGSLAEVQSLLYVAIDQTYITDEQFSQIYTKAEEVARIVSGLITSLRKRDAQ
jgi:four helix bundle protein